MFQHACWHKRTSRKRSRASQSQRSHDQCWLIFGQCGRALPHHLTDTSNVQLSPVNFVIALLGAATIYRFSNKDDCLTHVVLVRQPEKPGSIVFSLLGVNISVAGHGKEHDRRDNPERSENIWQQRILLCMLRRSMMVLFITSPTFLLLEHYYKLEQE